MSDLTSPRPNRNEELAVLVELEARWENLRAARTASVPLSLQSLQDNQRAYETFRTKLAAYNKRHAPAHVAEVLINTPARLEQWCKAMSALFAAVGASVPPPVQLLDKAYRLADRIAVQRRYPPAARPADGTPRSAADELDQLARWCAALPQVDASAA